MFVVYTIEQGPQGMAEMFTTLFNLAMRLEREQFLNAADYERSSERLGYANGTKPKKVDTRAGTLRLDIPKTRETPEPFYPQSLECQCRSKSEPPCRRNIGPVKRRHGAVVPE